VFSAYNTPGPSTALAKRKTKAVLTTWLVVTKNSPQRCLSPKRVDSGLHHSLFSTEKKRVRE
jgi:hypothetical protein